MRGQDTEAAEAAVIAENPLTLAGGGKRGKAAPVAPLPAEAKLIEIKIKKPSHLMSFKFSILVSIWHQSF